MTRLGALVVCLGLHVSAPARAAESVESLVRAAEEAGTERAGRAWRLLRRAIRRNKTTREVADDRLPLMGAWLVFYAVSDVVARTQSDGDRACAAAERTLREVSPYAPGAKQALSHPGEQRFLAWPMLLVVASACDANAGRITRARRRLDQALRFSPLFSGDPNDGLNRAIGMARHNLRVAERAR